MMRRLSRIFLSGAMLITLSVATPFALAQQDTQKAKPTVGGQMKEGTTKAAKKTGGAVKKAVTP